MAAMVQDFKDCHRKIMAIIPEMKVTRRATLDQCKELEKQLEDMIVLVQTEEMVKREKIAEVLQQVKELLTCVLNQQEDLYQTVKELKIKCERLGKELDSFKTSLIAGQIVSSFERAVAQRILKDTKQENNCIVTLYQIEDILENNKSRFLPKILETPKEKDKVASNWEALDKCYGLSEDHYSCIQQLKRCRNTTAHPSMTIQEAQGHLKTVKNSSLRTQERDMCIEMLEVMRRMGVANI